MTVLTSNIDYPPEYPCPTWEFGFDVIPHVRRNQFDCGWTRQRRRYDDFRSNIQLTFQMDTSTFDDWANWADKIGYEFFNIDLDVYGGTTQTTVLRFTGPIQYTYTQHDKITVTVPAESYGG